MSREQAKQAKHAKHAVHLNIDADTYNILIDTLLLTQFGGNELIGEHAAALIYKIANYARRYSENEKEYAEIRFFESEVQNLIWLLLTELACYLSDVGDYYHVTDNTE